MSAAPEDVSERAGTIRSVAPFSIRLRLLASIPIVLVMLSACGDTFRSPAAVVDGTSITDDELRSEIPIYRFLATVQQTPCGQPIAGESTEKACVRLVLADLVQQRIASDYASRHDITIPHRVVDRTIRSLELRLGGHGDLLRLLRRHGTTYPEFRALVERLILVRAVVRAVAADTIPEHELRTRYEQERIQFTQIHVAHILVSTKAEAQTIANEATPANFASLAESHSRDPASAARGGDLGTVLASQLDPDFVKAALALQPGEISGPVHTQFGWHVILLKSLHMVPFRLAKTQLIAQEAGDAFGAWVRAKFREGSVEINPRYGRLDTSTGRILPVRSTASTSGV